MGSRFQLLRRLGDGGMGVVYEALDKGRNHRVALKTLSRVEPSAIYYLKNEFRALADVVHPNLVALHELFAEDDTWFFTMDLIDGLPFVNYVRHFPVGQPDQLASTITVRPVSKPSGSRPSGQEIPLEGQVQGHVDEHVLRDAMMQLANGVQAIHDAGKLHRDLKPSNVLVTKDGRVKILDFGLVSGQAPGSVGETVVGGLVGTPAYMAPEQARGSRATAQSDWYAVGVILYEALTGRLPFSGALYEILNAKQQQAPVRPCEIDPSLPAVLDELCMALLRVKPEERPSGPEVLARLGSAEPTAYRILATVETAQRSAPRQGKSIPFVGRRDQMEQLATALDDTEAGKPVIVRLHGLSGMGKSALLREFMTSAEEEHGAVVLNGRCYERESVPYKGIDGVVDSLTRHMRRLPPVDAARLIPRHIQALARIFPVLQRVEAVASAPQRRAMPPDPGELRRRAVTALGELLERISSESPLVLVIDDMQWADIDSVTLLRDLLTFPEPPSCLCVLSYRSDETERSEALQALGVALDENFDVRAIELEGLSVEEVSELGQALASSGTRVDAEGLWRESQGSPYFVQELVLRALEGSDDAPLSSSKLNLDDALRARVGQLEEQPRRFLQMLAVAGCPTPSSVITMALGIEDEMGCLRALRAGNFVRTGGGIVEAYHHRVREAVIESLSPEAIRELHGRIAPVLELHRAEPQALAEHFRGAGHVQKAFDYAVIAAERASEALAFDRAARFYEIALELSPADAGEDTAGLRRKWAAALAHAGRSAESAKAYEEAARYVEGGEAVSLRSLSAAQKLLAGRVDEGIAGVKASLRASGIVIPDDQGEQFMAREAALSECRLRIKEAVASMRWRSEMDISLDDRVRLDVLHGASLGLYGLDMSPLVSLLAARNVLASIEAMEPTRCLQSVSLLCSLIRAQGVPPKREYMQILDLVQERMDNPLARAWGKFNEGCSHYWQMNAVASVPHLTEAEEIFSNECHGVTRQLGIVRLKLAVQLLMSGQFGMQAKACDRWQHAARERGDLFLELWMTFLSLKRPCSGEVEACRRETEAALSRLEALSGVDASQSMIGVAQMSAACRLSEIDLYEGQVERAWHRMDAFYGRWMSSLGIAGVPLHRSILFCYMARSLAGMAGSGSWSSEAAAKAKALADELSSSALDYNAAHGFLLLAAMAKQQGRMEEAMEFLQTAAARMGTCAPAWSHCIARQLGKLKGADGLEAVQAADRTLREEGIVDPERFAAALAPGF